MLSKIFGPRKRRTREHVIADQSVNYVERFIIDEGHIAQRMDNDYGYDLAMITFDDRGYVEPDLMCIQLKAADSLQSVGVTYVFDLDVRDYNLWMQEKLPVILILYDVSRRRAYWLAIQAYFDASAARNPQKGAKTIRVRIPKRQVVNRRAVALWRKLKREALGLFTGEES